MLEKLKEIAIPKTLLFGFGDLIGSSDKEIDKFVCHRELEEDLECKEIIVMFEDKEILEVIPREIKLSKGDILHFEYTLNVKFG